MAWCGSSHKEPKIPQHLLTYLHLDKATSRTHRRICSSLEKPQVKSSHLRDGALGAPEMLALEPESPPCLFHSCPPRPAPLTHHIQPFPTLPACFCCQGNRPALCCVGTYFSFLLLLLIYRQLRAHLHGLKLLTASKATPTSVQCHTSTVPAVDGDTRLERGEGFVPSSPATDSCPHTYPQELSGILLCLQLPEGTLWRGCCWSCLLGNWTQN